MDVVVVDIADVVAVDIAAAGVAVAAVVVVDIADSVEMANVLGMDFDGYYLVRILGYLLGFVVEVALKRMAADNKTFKK